MTRLIRPTRFTTRAEAAEINRRLKQAGYTSTAELCYDYCGKIMDFFGGNDPDSRLKVHRILTKVLD